MPNPFISNTFCRPEIDESFVRSMAATLAGMAANTIKNLKINSEAQVKEEPSEPQEHFSGVSPEEQLENNSLHTSFTEKVNKRFVKHLYFDQCRAFISVLICC